MTTSDNRINVIEWQDAESSAVNRIGYDSINLNIYVEFARGAIYRYSGCDQRDWSALNDAGSIGSYVNNLLAASHQYEEVTAP